MRSRPNLTRFTYVRTAFQGWRMSVTKCRVTFTKYFPDRKYGGEQNALAAAEATLMHVRNVLSKNKDKKNLTQSTRREVRNYLAKL